MRREEHYVGRRVTELKRNVVGKEDALREDGWTERWVISKKKGLSADDVYDRVTRRRMSSYIEPTSKWE